MSWCVAVLGFACAIELILIVALDRYAHGLARRLEQLERMSVRPATPPRVASRGPQGAVEA
ncbi:MAG TPA: hypothetical protein VHZ31_01025 [Solirubrobacteraceae bacterium]|jgi:hypothetical protein|nr:hypothetical protein [Solirubrobacteraceae bacterium]